MCIQTAYYRKCKKRSEHLLLLWSGDIESNPGPQKSASICFFLWNLNSITTHNFYKLTLLDSDDKRLNIESYNLSRANHPENTKGGRGMEGKSCFLLVFINL